MSSVITCPFNFNDFKKIWIPPSLSTDSFVPESFIKNNQLLHESLVMQGHAMAILDIPAMNYFTILGDIERVCGLSADYLYQRGVEGLFEKILPEDLEGLREISKQINAYNSRLDHEQKRNFKAIFDYRIRQQDGSIRRVCQESITLTNDQEGNMIHGLVYVSDITFFKRNGKQHLHLSGGGINQILAIDNTMSTIKTLTNLAKRELAVARLLGTGLTSEQIANKMFISTNTVNTHRQNMLRKLELSDTTELLNFMKIYRLI